jgi:hypothetical protein
MPRRAGWTAAGIAVAGLALAAWAAFAPIVPPASREALVVIPRGTAARQARGERTETFPAVLRFTIGIRDVLVIRNEDDAAATFGPVLLGPGQAYRVPFRTPATFNLACSAHQAGSITIVVTETPAAGWARLAWRVENMLSR